MQPIVMLTLCVQVIIFYSGHGYSNNGDPLAIGIDGECINMHVHAVDAMRAHAKDLVVVMILDMCMVLPGRTGLGELALGPRRPALVPQVCAHALHLSQVLFGAVNVMLIEFAAHQCCAWQRCMHAVLMSVSRHHVAWILVSD